MKPMTLPVCTLSPVSNSDIVTDLPFSRVTLAVDGKQFPPPDGAGVDGTGIGGGIGKKILFKFGKKKNLDTFQ